MNLREAKNVRRHMEAIGVAATVACERLSSPLR